MLELKGKLDLIAFPELMQMMEMLRKSGCLTISSGDESVAFYFREGTIVGTSCHPKKPDDLLGQILVHRGRITAEQIGDALRMQPASRRRLGEILIGLGACDHLVVRYGLEAQALNLVLRALKWKDSEYQYQPGLLLPPEAWIKEPLSTNNILLAGLQMLDEWPVLREKISNDHLIFKPLDCSREMPGHKSVMDRVFEDSNVMLTRPDLEILAKLDGQITVGELTGQSGFSDFTVYKSLVKLLNSGLIEPLENCPAEVLPTPPPAASQPVPEALPAQAAPPLEAGIVRLILEGLVCRHPAIVHASLATWYGFLIAEAGPGGAPASEPGRLESRVLPLFAEGRRGSPARILVEDEHGLVAAGPAGEAGLVILLTGPGTPPGKIFTLLRDVCRTLSDLCETLPRP